MRKLFSDNPSMSLNMGGGVHATFIEITPEMASEILEMKTEFRNRKIRERTVNNYAKDMETNSWPITGDTIKFDRDGNLIDGQHRLSAIVKSGKTQKMLVVYGLDKSILTAIDIGLKRSLENALQFQGESYENGSSSIVRLRMTLDKGVKHIGQSEANMEITRQAQVDEYISHKDEYIVATKYAKEVYRNSRKYLNVNEVGAIYLYLTRTKRCDDDLVKEFFLKLYSQPLNNKSIFNTTINNLSNKKICKGVDRINEYIECWNAWLHNCKTQRNHYSDWFEIPKS